MFIGRALELSRLRKEFATNRPSLLVVYGRRRIGKSTLPREAARDRPHVLYQATRVTAALNLESLKAEIARSLGGDDLLNGLGDWLGVLTYLARKAEEMAGLVVVLDEFPYLVDADPSLPSVLQKVWDSGSPATGRLNLVLCGSLIAQMKSLLAERNPLYGRQTLAMELQSLPPRDAAAFVPGYSAEDQILTYGILGGVPFYLRLCDPGASLEENIVKLLLTDAGPLVDEPNVLLQSELRETQRYATILAAIADGRTKAGEINGRVRDIKDAVSLSPYMERLERMR
jgi:AAA+ ATPase superfamily predicted ATPase